MDKVQTISIELTPELNDMVQDVVSAGQFSTTGEVVREALRRWKIYEEAKAHALVHMRALIQEGIDSGPGREIDFDEFKAELHADFERRGDAKKRVA
jgi:antitoxin ParD1/3/4